ncbi:MAG: hypothetical protein ACE5L7_07930 [Candidatus Aminicenantales bacterium]
MEEEEIKEILLKENEEFRKAYRMHQQYEKKLEEFKKKGFLSEEEKLQEKELKKKKLALKDKMYYLMIEYRKSLS